MSKLSTLGSPGVEVREIDNSLSVDGDPSTTYFVPGFAAQGPVEEVHSIGTMSDFENIYGLPTNEAERYFYHTVKSIIDNSGNSTTVYVSRLPYGEKEGDTVSSAITLLSYPAVPIIKKQSETTEDYKEGLKMVSDEKELNHLMTLYTILDPETASRLEVKNAPTYTPVEVSKRVIIDEDYEFESLILTGLNLTTGLPNPLDFASFDGVTSINYQIIKDKNQTEIPVLTSVGSLAIEWKVDVKHLVVHVAFNIVDGDNKIGILMMSAEYENIDSDKVTTVKFKNDIASKVSFKWEDKYEIAASYDGQTDEQYEGDKYDTSKFEKDVTYIIGAPTSFHISLEEYYNIITGDTFKWSRRPYDMSLNGTNEPKKESVSVPGTDATFGKFDAINHSAFIVINTSRSIINDSFEGFYFGLCDNMFITPSSDYNYDAIRKIKTTTKIIDVEKNDDGLMDSHSPDSDFDTIGENRLGFYLKDNHSGSVSKIMERSITPMDISSTEYDDTLNLALFKLSKRVNANATLKLDYSIREKYNASLGKSRIKSDASASKPVSYFVENVTENSSNLVFMVNPYISERIYVDIDGVLRSKVRVFGTKLTNNLDFYEKKYLIDSFSPNNLNGDTNLMAPIKLAKNSVESFDNLVAQAGVTPRFLKKHFNLSENVDHEDYAKLAMADSLYPFGVYSDTRNSSKIIGNLPAKLERALDLVKNDEEYSKIDIIPEAGLGTVYVYSCSPVLVGESTQNDSFGFEDASSDGNNQMGDDDANITKLLFDPSIVIKGIEDMRTGRSSLSDEANDVIQNYRAVLEKFYNFCNSMQNGGRGDSFFIGDVLRGILIKGKDTKVSSLFGTRLDNSAYGDTNDDINHSFSTSIYYPIKHLYDTIVSSYGSTYAQWIKVLDNISSEKIWIPVSGYVAAMMGRSDAQSGPWLAAAGINRGVISGLDCAFSPNQDQRTDLYKICINAVPKIPNKGITIFGIRTMSKKASAFDQNTCRRTFLYMENTVKRYMRNYIFEPNTSYTRLQIVNDIEPFLEGVANSGGIYSWTCICDSTNNTPEIINNGDLAVDIAAAPTRTAENIILNFTANKYTSDISNTEI